MLGAEEPQLPIMLNLPEVPVERSAETYDNECADDIPNAPTLANALLEVRTEGDGINLSL